MTKMTSSAFTDPLEITPVEGEVAITGPDGFAGSITIEAAVESARRLLKAVESITGTASPTLLERGLKSGRGA